MSWRVARSLDVLLAEVNAAAPNRNKASDGSIGDAAHASRSSDHNPWVKLNGQGIVRARDITHDPANGVDCNVLADKIAALLGKHPALGSGAYVIWNRRIISTDRLREGWRPYSGSNAHTKHAHVSVAEKASGFDSTAAWGVFVDPETEPKATPKPSRVKRARELLLAAEKRATRKGQKARARVIRAGRRSLPKR